MNLHEFEKVLYRTILIPILTLLLFAGALIWQIEDTLRAERSLDRSDQVTADLHELERLIIDRETGLRGFQLTGHPEMLAPYDSAGQQLESQFAELRGLVAQDPGQARRLTLIRERYETWQVFAQSVLAKPFDQSHDPELNLRGKRLMDNVRASSTEMVDAEEQQRAQESAGLQRRIRTMLTVILLSAVAVGLGLALLIWKQLHRVSDAFRSALDESHAREEELYASRQWFETTLESIGDGVIACDVEGRIEFMNAVAQAMTKWDPEEAKGLPLEDVFRIVNEETRLACENPVAKVRRLKTIVGLANHTVLIAKDGSELVLDDSAAPIRDQHGEMRGIVLIFRDVTEYRRTEAALIAGEKLAVAGRLAASIAHEIHNPLDSVANLHFLMMSEPDPEKRDRISAHGSAGAGTDDADQPDHVEPVPRTQGPDRSRREGTGRRRIAFARSQAPGSEHPGDARLQTCLRRRLPGRVTSGIHQPDRQCCRCRRPGRKNQYPD